MIHELEIDGRPVIDRGEILEGIKDFYQDLYTSGETEKVVQDHYLSFVDRVLSLEDQMTLDEFITQDEVKKAVFEMSKKKAPGSDGLSVEFYQKYWHIVGLDLTAALNNGWFAGRLDNTLLEAIICLSKRRAAPSS